MFHWKKHTTLLNVNYKCRLAGEQFYKWGSEHPWVKAQITDHMNDEELERADEWAEKLREEDENAKEMKRRFRARPVQV